MRQPLVSIIIPMYNAESTIERAVCSVLRQSYEPIELIIVDDGSTDQSTKVLKQFSSGVHLIQQPNRGESSARNRGVADANGELIAFLDADDQYEPNKVERQIEVLRTHPEIDVLGTHRQRIRGSVRLPRRTDSKSEIELVSLAMQFKHNQVCGASIMLRRSLLIELGVYDEELTMMPDYDLILRLLMKPAVVANLTEPLYVFYEHSQSVRSCSDRLYEGYDRLIQKYQRLACDQQIPEGIKMSQVIAWWLFKSAVLYQQRQRFDLRDNALRRAAQQDCSRLLKTLIKGSTQFPWVLSFLDQFRVYKQSTG